MDYSGLPTSPITPPPNPLPQVPVEDPQIQKPVNQTVRGLKKLAPKLAVGMFMFALLVGGAWMGVNQVQERQVVEQQANYKKCSDYGGVSECKDKCGAAKDDGNRYNCKWIKNECKESSDKCSNASMPPGTDAGACFDGAANCYYCPNVFTIKSCGAGNGTLPGGVHYEYNGGNCQITGNWCGLVQCDKVGGSSTEFRSEVDRDGCDVNRPSPSPSVSPSPSPSPSASPSPSPSPNLSCVSLTKNVVTPKLNDTVAFTCTGNFSSTNPVAQFRYSTNNGTTFHPVASVTVVGTQAVLSYPINETGSWLVQCRVCTDATATTCTTWGLAN